MAHRRSRSSGRGGICIAALGEPAQRQIFATLYAAQEQKRLLALRGSEEKRGNKYHAKRCEMDGYAFDSHAEMQRYRDLKLMQAAGVIRQLEVHPSFDLMVQGVRIGRYVADFAYQDRASRWARKVEDVKSKPTMTAVYRIKKKLMLALHGVEIVEVFA